MSSGIDIVVGINNLFDLCRDTDELGFCLFLKSGLLGDRSGNGVREICGKGNISLTKKEGTYYWKCGSRCHSIFRMTTTSNKVKNWMFSVFLMVRKVRLVC